MFGLFILIPIFLYLLFYILVEDWSARKVVWCCVFQPRLVAYCCSFMLLWGFWPFLLLIVSKFEASNNKHICLRGPYNLCIFLWNILNIWQLFLHLPKDFFHHVLVHTFTSFPSTFLYCACIWIGGWNQIPECGIGFGPSYFIFPKRELVRGLIFSLTFFCFNE